MYQNIEFVGLCHNPTGYVKFFKDGSVTFKAGDPKPHEYDDVREAAIYDRRVMNEPLSRHRAPLHSHHFVGLICVNWNQVESPLPQSKLCIEDRMYRW